MSAAVLRALGAARVAAARAALATAEAERAQLDAIADRMDRAVEGDPDQLVNADAAGVSRPVWNRAVRARELKAKKVGREYAARRADVATWLASLAAPSSPATSPKSEHAEPADPFERARARARDRRAA